MFLDKEILSQFRNIVSDNNRIILNDEKLKEHYNLICVVMDRMETSINYLNKNSSAPMTEEDFLSFIMFAVCWWMV